MYLPDVELHETTTLAEAAELKKRFGSAGRLLAGGTDLLVDLKTGRLSAKHLISLNRIDTLRGLSLTDDPVSQSPGCLQIGALTTITQLTRSKLVRERFPPLLDATLHMAAPPIRNVATVGGNIISAVPCANLPPILMVMGARVQLWSSAGERSVALDSLFLGPRRTVLRDDEILASVLVPEPKPSFGAAYEWFGLREGNAIAVAAVAAGLRLGDDNTIQSVGLVLGAVAPIPKPVEAATSFLKGQPADATTFEKAAQLAKDSADPITDVRGTAHFRRELVEVLTRRALTSAHRRARGMSQ